jgi:hypothetical protein
MDESIRDDSADSPLLEYTAGTTEKTSIVVLRAVATVSNTAITDLPPLYETIAPDAVDGIFPPDQQTGQLRFRYYGYAVVVTADRTIAISHVSEDG